MYRWLIDGSELFEQLCTHFFALFKKIGWNLNGIVFRTDGLIEEEVGLHRNEVDHPFESASDPIGQWTGTAFAPSLSLIDLTASKKVSADTVHFVDESYTRNSVASCLTPNGLRLRLHSGNGIEHGTAPSRTRKERSTSMVKSTWPGVSMMLILLSFPIDGRGSGGDGNATLFAPAP